MSSNEEHLIPFTKNDARINRAGRPRDYEALRQLVRRVGSEIIGVKEDGTPLTKIEAIVRDWMDSKSFHKQLAAVQYGYGKVPEKLEVERNASKIVIRWSEMDEEPEEMDSAEFTTNSALGGRLEVAPSSEDDSDLELLEPGVIDPED